MILFIASTWSLAYGCSTDENCWWIRNPSRNYLKLLVRELGPIVRCYNPWDSEPGDDAIPHEFLALARRNLFATGLLPVLLPAEAFLESFFQVDQGLQDRFNGYVRLHKFPNAVNADLLSLRHNLSYKGPADLILTPMEI
ncbi:hypothetical protein PIB30_056979 [Stylosanthes scabra]|uniref:Uncharacterized protein n=1 Tax=Stylosanthes scabra TaxID=79078 RepID=A0ABU6SL96_9FABA|nr:hypothetical protein [Stylosanthes scabra]